MCLIFDLTEKAKGTSLAVQWLRIHASTTGELGLAPGRGPTTCRAQPKKEEKKPTIFFNSPHNSVGKESTCNAGDPGSIPGSEDPPEKG